MSQLLQFTSNLKIKSYLPSITQLLDEFVTVVAVTSLWGRMLSCFNFLRALLQFTRGVREIRPYVTSASLYEMCAYNQSLPGIYPHIVTAEYIRFKTCTYYRSLSFLERSLIQYHYKYFNLSLVYDFGISIVKCALLYLTITFLNACMIL